MLRDEWHDPLEEAKKEKKRINDMLTSVADAVENLTDQSGMESLTDQSRVESLINDPQGLKRAAEKFAASKDENEMDDE
jgi:hypothetical protein